MTSTANPTEGVDDLTCAIAGSTDDDGDSVDYTYKWYDPNGTNVQIMPGQMLFDTFWFSFNT